MTPKQTVSRLASFAGRGAGTDAERRAAGWLAHGLASFSDAVSVETFWCRPNRLLAHVWHAVLGVAASLLATASPRVAGAIAIVAILSVISDELFGYSLGRRLTPERASQNVIARAPGPASPGQLHLILTANYDAGRQGTAYARPLRRMAARARWLTGGRGPGWVGWLTILLAWVLAAAVWRTTGARGLAVSLVQVVPTFALIIGIALLFELATSDFGPAAGDNGSGVAAVLALARALRTAPPARMAVEVVLQGASDGTGVGLRRHLRRRRPRLTAPQVVVLGLAPCGAGEPRWWISDGPFVPLRYLSQLDQLCRQVAAEQARLEALPHRGRGATPALPARAAQLPAIAVGCLDRDGLVPSSHSADDRPEAVHEGALAGAVTFALMVIDAIDAFLRDRRPQTPSTASGRAAVGEPAARLTGAGRARALAARLSARRRARR